MLPCENFLVPFVSTSSCSNGSGSSKLLHRYILLSSLPCEKANFQGWEGVTQG